MVSRQQCGQVGEGAPATAQPSEHATPCTMPTMLLIAIEQDRENLYANAQSGPANWRSEALRNGQGYQWPTGPGRSLVRLWVEGSAARLELASRAR